MAGADQEGLIMPFAWLRFQQTLALAAFVAGCTVAEMQLRLIGAAISPAASIRAPRIRLVSNLHGIEIDPDFVKDAKS